MGALLTNWGPVVLWAAVIFGFSTDSFSASQTAQIVAPALNWLIPGITAYQLEAVHLAIRKLGHWSEYFVFAIFVRRALRHQSSSRSELRHNGLTTVIIFLYALSDELHQAFVPNRTSSFGDVLIDLFGGICAVSWLSLRRKWKKKP